MSSILADQQRPRILARMLGGGGGGGGCGVSPNEYSCAHGTQIKFGNPTPYLTQVFTVCVSAIERLKTEPRDTEPRMELNAGIPGLQAH